MASHGRLYDPVVELGCRKGICIHYLFKVRSRRLERLVISNHIVIIAHMSTNRAGISKPLTNLAVVMTPPSEKPRSQDLDRCVKQYSDAGRTCPTRLDDITKIDQSQHMPAFFNAEHIGARGRPYDMPNSNAGTQ